ncbi:D-alanyl-D-alanine carboxypeptidase family protein [Priestia megaterium]
MKNKRARWVLIIFSLLLVVSMLLPYLAYAAEDEGPQLSSDAAYLYNTGTGEELYGKNEDKQFAIHNLSMLMTTYILIKDIESGKVSVKDKAKISEKSWRAPEPRMFLEVGRKVPVQKLLEGLTIAAGNDAAITTAEYLDGSTDKFVKRMNKEAKKLGMKNTEFHTPNGSNQDMSTAKDLFILAKALTDKYPQYQDYFTQSKMKYDTRPGKTVILKNQNNFINDNPHSTGLKSGWGNHQYHLVASVNKNGMKFIAVTLNASTPSKRSTDIYNLLIYGYNQYQVINIARAGEKYTDFSVYKSTTPGPSTVAYKDNVSVVTRVGVPEEELELDYEGHSYILGGTKEGDDLGTVNIYHDGRLLTKAPVVATESFERVKGFHAALDSIALVFRQIFDFVSNAHH